MRRYSAVFVGSILSSALLADDGWAQSFRRPGPKPHPAPSIQRFVPFNNNSFRPAMPGGALTRSVSGQFNPTTGAFFPGRGNFTLATPWAFEPVRGTFTPSVSGS